MNEAIRELRATLEQQQAAGKTVAVFFRDDDVDEDEASLRRLLSLFAAKNVPVILGVIPARLTTAGIALLQQFSASAELVQHGWQHVNHETTGRKCEFGASRSFEEQLTDLARGQARMNEAFGAHWFPAWNRCTDETYQALAQLDFQVLSKLRESNAPLTGFPFQEISVTLDLYRWKDGAQLKPIDELVPDLAQQMRQDTPIGIMLHHKVMSDDAFTFLAALLEEFSRYTSVRFHRFQSLLQAA
jgi:peptidoglycan/xylan/chitin deacetylase (PgdA/CDA1 family)